MQPLGKLFDRLLDKIHGTPDMASALAAAVQHLAQRGHLDIKANVERGEVTTKTSDGGSQVFSLKGLLPTYQRASRSERLDVLTRHFDSLHVVASDIHASYAIVKPKLMPVIRSVESMGLARQETQVVGAPAGCAPLWRPLAGGLVVALVIDQPDSMAYVSEDSFADWGVSWEQVYADAIANLRDLKSPGGWRERTPGVWSGEWGDGYDSSRLLLDDMIWRLGVSDPVAFLPCRNVILVTSARSEEGVAQAMKIGDAVLSNGSRSLSWEWLSLTGRTWASFHPTGAGLDAQVEMRHHFRAMDYQAQHDILARQLEGVDGAPYLTNFKLFQDAQGKVHEFAVWAEGVDALLPAADNIFMLFEEGEGHWQAQIPLETVLFKFPDLLELTDHVPRRYRARHFPEREHLRAVAAEYRKQW